MIWQNPNSPNSPLPEPRDSFDSRIRSAAGAPRLLHASPAEYETLNRLLAAPPPRGSLSAESYGSIITEVRQLVQFIQTQQRVVHTDIINGIVQQALVQHCLENGLARWDLVKMEDHLRSGTDRTYTFGQVTDRDQECFGGLWQVRENSRKALMNFRIGVVTELIEARRETNLPSQDLSLIYQRGPRSWEHQVPRDSELGVWLTSIFGAKTLGYFPQHRPLGVFTDAVRRFADAEGITHLLLPRSRRDPGTKPWHVGAFMRFDGEQFVWSGWGLLDGASPILLTLGIRPHCEILGVRPFR